MDYLMEFDTPILLLWYNRRDTSKIVLDSLRTVKPRRLFVAADGPSEERIDDKKRCEKTRSLIQDIDWSCEVKTLFHEHNLGCRKAISSAISWFFDQVEEGIILEDDCLPSQSFFRFCQELLEHYRDIDEVMAISGDNFQSDRKVTRDSYYFSRYPHCWGWATWRRAWNKYDTQLRAWNDFKDSPSFQSLGADSSSFKNYWSRIFERVLAGEIDSWAYVWTYSCWVNGGLTVIPEKNLVKNIGFGPDATHTKNVCERIGSLRAEDLNFPLQHPPSISRHVAADLFTDEVHFGIRPTENTGLTRFLLNFFNHAMQRCFHPWNNAK